MIEISCDPPGALDDVMAIMRDAFDPEFGEAWTEGQCSGVLAMPGTRLLVAHAPEPVGFALMRTVVDEAELMLLAVRAERRGAGIGRALLCQSFEIAEQSGVSSFFLEVRAENRAIDLYLASGLRQVGFRKDYYRGGDGRRHDALTFRKLLR